MKVLYGITTTGNGHWARSKEIIPALENEGFEIDILLSGPKNELEINRPVKYRKKSLTTPYDMFGGLDLMKTFREADILTLIRDIKNLDMTEYDLVISDFDPITAWAARTGGVKSIGIAHQYSLLSQELKREFGLNPLLDAVLRFYAGCTVNLGINYKSTEKDIFSPIIRKEIRDAENKVTEENHFTVYLSAYKTDFLIDAFKKHPEHEWHVFSSQVKKERVTKNVHLRKINNENFVESLISSKGLCCSSGFTATCEALFLGKKLLAFPMKNHMEQSINSQMLAKIGVKSIYDIGNNFERELNDWLINWPQVKMHYPNVIPDIVKRVKKVTKG